MLAIHEHHGGLGLKRRNNCSKSIGILRKRCRFLPYNGVVSACLKDYKLWMKVERVPLQPSLDAGKRVAAETLVINRIGRDLRMRG